MNPLIKLMTTFAFAALAGVASAQVSDFEKMVGDAVLQPPEYKRLGTLFLARTNSPNAEILNHVINGVAAGLAAVAKGDVYTQRIRPFVADPQALEASLTVSCDKCGEAGTQEIKCSSCKGSGTCNNTGCNNGVTVRPVMNGGNVEGPCIVCKGTGKCPKCQGTGTTTYPCSACKGKKTVFSPNKASTVYSLEFQAAQKCFDDIRKSGEEKLAQAAEKRKLESQAEDDRKAAKAHAEKLRQAEVEAKKIAATAEGEAVGKERARIAVEAEQLAARQKVEKELAERDKKYLKCAVVIEGDRAVGTGFLCVFGGKKVVLSNAHVLCGNRKLKLRSIAGGDLTYTRVNVCKDRDAVVYELADTKGLDFLKVYENVGNMNNQEEVAVFGNSQGGGVVTTLRGKMQGIGPETIEVDAKFVHGNSGSPVIAYPYDAVVGMATYATKNPEVDWTTRSTRFADVRRFCVRVDNIGWDRFFVLDNDEYCRALDVFDAIYAFANNEVMKAKWLGSSYQATPEAKEKAERLLEQYRATPEWMRLHADDPALAAYICTLVLK